MPTAQYVLMLVAAGRWGQLVAYRFALSIGFILYSMWVCEGNWIEERKKERGNGNKGGPFSVINIVIAVTASPNFCSIFYNIRIICTWLTVILNRHFNESSHTWENQWLESNIKMVNKYAQSGRMTSAIASCVRGTGSDSLPRHSNLWCKFALFKWRLRGITL